MLKLRYAGRPVYPGNTPAFNGIKFPAVQVPSADPNTLDDYEEGFWTPIDASGAGLVITIVGNPPYIKIGQWVWAYAFITYPVTASGLNSSIGGLPFLVFNNQSNRAGGVITDTDEATLSYIVPVNGTFVTGFFNSVGANIANVTLSGNTILFCVTYYA